MPSTPLARLLSLALALGLTAQVFYLGSQPVAVDLISAPWDKLAHLVFYSAVTLLFLIATGGRARVAIALAVMALGALDEAHQVLLPGRYADVLDLAVDIVAVAATAWILVPYESRRKQCAP